MTPTRPALGRTRGFTLVECAIVCAVTAVLVAVAMPSYRGEALRAARLDAVQALTKIQLTQEQHRSQHGLYAGELAQLRGVAPVSQQGRYAITVALDGPDGYRATATARGAQSRDTPCRVLTLDVAQGFAKAGPDLACWNR